MQLNCPHCHTPFEAPVQPIAEYWADLTPGLVTVLHKLARAVGRKGENAVHPLKDIPKGSDLRLTENERGNLTHLRHHALVAKVRKRPGYWLLTRRGSRFLRGLEAVPDRVLTRENRVVGHGERLVTIHQVVGQWFQERYDYEIAEDESFRRLEQTKLFELPERKGTYQPNPLYQ